MRWLLAAAVVGSAGCSTPTPAPDTCDAPPPQLLGTGCDLGISMAVAPDGVYWTNPCEGMVLHAAASGAGAEVVLRSGALKDFQRAPMLVTPQDVYLGNRTGLTRFSRADGGSSPALSDPVTFGSAVALDGQLVWSLVDHLDAQATDGGAPRTLAPPQDQDILWLLADQPRHRVYWLDRRPLRTSHVESASLELEWPLDRDTAARPELLAQDDDFVYWAEAGVVAQTSKELTGSARIFAPAPSSVFGIAGTPDAIYVAVDGWVGVEDGRAAVHPSQIQRLSKDGAPQGIAVCGTEDLLYGTLAAHDGSLYWLGGAGVWTAPAR